MTYIGYRKMLRRGGNRYLTHSRLNIFKPLIVFWVLWAAISFMPVEGYFMVMPAVLVFSWICVKAWYEVAAFSGYDRRMYFGLNAALIVVFRIIGSCFSGRVFDLLVKWRIIYEL